ncbi:hypothetical protein BGX34_000521 [Mortierella sp. NVP85]|nr:hypothetical protein BGX34_000521 [Mortierella sp. NVP85]
MSGFFAAPRVVDTCADVNLHLSWQEELPEDDDFMPPGFESAIAKMTDAERLLLVGRILSNGSTTSFKSISVPSIPINSTSTATSTAKSIKLNAPVLKPPPSKTVKPKTPKVPKPSRSYNGMEDIFTEEQVRNWSEVRIKTWDHRRTNPEAFYYRFVDPTEGQQNGPWSTESTRQFMTRLDEWKARGIRIGTSWGVFSMKVSHKAGYQCSAHYRRLLETKKLTDPSYAWEGGKLIMVNKTVGGDMVSSELSERWDTDEVRTIEANVNRWIKEYHINTIQSLAAKSRRPTLATPSAPSTQGSSRPGALIFKPSMEAPRVKATTAPAIPQALSIVRPSKQQPTDEKDPMPVININDKLAEYSSFMRKSSSSAPNEPDRIRQSISFAVPGTVEPSSVPPTKAIVPIEVKKAPMASFMTKGQTGLALFWKNIRPVRVECPDIPKFIIPKDVELRSTWVHRIQPFEELNGAPVEGSIYKEVPRIMDFDWKTLSDGFDEPVDDIQGIMADPPWAFIVEDGRNDGACKLTPNEFGEIMEKALETMPSGIVSIWTHKAILPEIVSIMHGLGCRYVENLVWYKIALNNANLDRASPYFRNSKEIMLMFKKGDGFDIRHQRSADVVMDFEKPTSSWINEDYTEPKPEGAYEMMETLLPDARYTPETGRGRLLELWAKRCQERRPGWFSIHELKPPLTTKVEAAPEADDLEDEALLARIVNDMDLDMDW